MCQTMEDFYEVDQEIRLKNGNKGKIIELFGQNSNDVRSIVKMHGYFNIRMEENLEVLRVIPANAEVLYENEITVLELVR